MAISKKREESFSLIPGSYYLIKSAGSKERPLETRGKFRGFATIAEETALVIELDDPPEEKGRLRFIPVPTILSVDVLKAAERLDEPKEKQIEGIYFG
ncbi:MAG: hypothetical protein QXE45_04775 [Thermoplasmata archaeon]